MPRMDVNGATIAYTDTGPPPGQPDAPAILFGHGLLFNGWMFHPQIAALRDRYRCVTIDWRGQGDTPATRSGYDMDTLTADAIGLIDKLDLAPVHYVGLSMGGFVGLRIAARHGELLQSLTVLDSSADEEDPAHVREYRLLSVVYQLVGIIAPVRDKAIPLMFGPTFLSVPENQHTITEWISRLRRCRRSGIRKAVLGVANRPSVMPELARITSPTLVMVGTEDIATPPHQSDRIAAAIPNAHLQKIPHSGHTSTLEQPTAVTTHLEAFLTNPTKPVVFGADGIRALIAERIAREGK